MEVSGTFNGIGANAKRSIEFSVENSYSKGQSQAHTRVHQAGLTSKVNAKAHTETPISISFGKGSLEVEVDLEYRLVGFCHAAYIQKSYNGSLVAPKIEINDLLQRMGLPRTVKDREINHIGFVTSGKIVIGEVKHLKKNPNE